MKVALIGCTGFVGQSILRSREISHRISRNNIASYAGAHFDLLIIAAGDARKWYANQNPREDAQHIRGLQAAISRVRASRVVQISTVDVLDGKAGDEQIPIIPSHCDTYGRNRLELEDFVRKQFVRCSVVRLPGLFGRGLKKNMIFDISQGRALSGFNPKSTFQWFDMNEVNRIIDLSLEHELPLLHVCGEPLIAGELASALNGQVATMQESAPLVRYDVHTRYGHLMPGSPPGYLYWAADTLQRIRHFMGGRL